MYMEKQRDSNNLKLVNNRYHYDLRKFFHAPLGIRNVWNSLPEIVISANTTDTFKRTEVR